MTQEQLSLDFRLGAGRLLQSRGGAKAWWRAGILAGIGLALHLPATGYSQATAERLKSFGCLEQSGGACETPLLLGADGVLYGTTRLGVFRLSTDGSAYTLLHRFGTGADDGMPCGGLVQGSDGALYGTTLRGGALDFGTVFVINTDGTGYRVLLSLNYGDDIWRPGELVFGPDGALYGTSSTAVFRLHTDGSALSVLHQFSRSEGMNNTHGGPLIGRDGLLYCSTTSTASGGVFRMRTDGTGCERLLTFPGIADAQVPWDSLIQGRDGGLYGTAYGGGSGSNGVVFRVDAETAGYEVVHAFAADGSEGQYPMARVMQGKDGALYGTTSFGVQNNSGTVFRVNTNGTGFQVLHRFHLIPGEGVGPHAGLIQAEDGTLYGTTSSGGSPDGVVFRINPDGTGYTVLHSFSPSGGDGCWPVDGLVQHTGGALYGTTMGGGAHAGGTVFKMNPDGSGYEVIHSFFPYGTGPCAPLVPGADGAFYGTTWSGGTYSRGTLFKVDPDTARVTILRSFGSTSDNCPWISEPLTPAGGALYGIAGQGGTAGSGALFKVNPDGSGFALLHSFGVDPGDGVWPDSGLILANDGALYGTTPCGGAGGDGTLFRINRDGTGYHVFYNFPASPAVNGPGPLEALVQGADGALFGISAGGGRNDEATLFRVNPDGTAFTVLHDFGIDPADGHGLPSKLLQSRSGVFYGTTEEGGINNLGTLFTIQPDGQGYQVLYHFGAPGGVSKPGGSLLEGADGALYGTTMLGGEMNMGTVYRLTFAPFITSQPISLTCPSGATATFRAAAGGAPTVTWQWQKDGIPLFEGGEVSGVDTPTLTLSNVTAEAGGQYAVLVSNLRGSILSAPALLDVVAAPRFESASRLPDGSIELRLAIAGNLTYRVETSIDLAHWEPLTTISGVNGVVPLVVGDASVFPSRFYRAVWAP